MTFSKQSASLATIASPVALAATAWMAVMMITPKANVATLVAIGSAKAPPVLHASVVLAALDDAIADDKKYGNGPEQIARWARSRDGREVLTCAGIDPNERVVSGLMEFVSKGVRTSVALSREESERRHAAEAQAQAA